MNGAAPAAAFPLLLLVPAAIAGVALINTGLCRARNAAHAMAAALCVGGVVALAWFVTGFALAGGAVDAAGAALLFCAHASAFGARR